MLLGIAPERKEAIMLPWLNSSDDHRLPRLHHWLLALIIILVMNVAVPIFAAFT